MRRNDRGSTLVEIIIALMILGVAGVAMINAMSSGSAAARKTQGKSTSFYQLTSATEAYGSAAYVDCSPTLANPYVTAGKIPVGAVHPRISVQIQTLTKSGTSWVWQRCGDGRSWGGLENAKIQRITLQYRLRAEACTSIDQAQTSSCLTRSLLKSDSNNTSQYGVVGGFRVWPVSPMSLVWNEKQDIALNVAGAPSPTDQIVFTILSTSAGISATANSGGITVTAGATSGTYAVTVGACDITIGSCDPAASNYNALGVAAPATITFNVFEPLSITSATTFTGNVGYARAPSALTYRGGNGQPVTFTTTASPLAWTLTSDGQFGWTTSAPASPINGAYNVLTPHVIPVTLTQPGLTPTTINLSVTLYSQLRLITPAQPPLALENIILDSGSTAPFTLKAVGGNPTLAITMAPSNSNFPIGSSSLSQGVSSANMTLKSTSQAVDKYSFNVNLSGAGWPTSLPFAVTTIVRPVVTDPGLIESALGTAGSYNLLCSCSGGTNITYAIDSSWNGSGFTLTSAGLLSWPKDTAMGTYTIPITVSAKGPSGAVVTSAIRNVRVAVYGPLRLIKPLTDEFLTFNYGSSTPDTIKATGGRPSQVITIATSSTQFTIGTATLADQVSTANITPKSTSWPGVGQSAIPITLSGASATTVTTSAGVRVRPVLNAPAAISGMNGFAGQTSIVSSCSCTGAASTRYRIDSSFNNSAITISTDGILRWTDSVAAGTYSVPVIVSGANANGIFVDSLPTNISLVISRKLTLTSPTSTQSGGFGFPPVGGFVLNADGGNGSTASFKIQSGYAQSSYFTISTNSAAYDASTRTSVGSITYTSTAPVGSYSVPIMLFGGGAPSDVGPFYVNITIRPGLAISSTSNAACQSFTSTTLASPCIVTITYTANTGSGVGIKLTSTPTGTYAFFWSTSSSSTVTSTPFPATSSTTTLTLYFWKNTTKTSFCYSAAQASGSINVTVQDALSTATASASVSVKC